MLRSTLNVVMTIGWSYWGERNMLENTLDQTSFTWPRIN